MNMQSKEVIKHNEKPLSVEDANLLAVIERVATNPNADVEKMRALLDMQERIMAKNAEIAFNQAIVGMDIPSIIKKSEIKHGDKLISKYAKYEEIDDVVRPIYTQAGFAISFDTKTDNGKITVRGTLSHKDGHSRSTEIELPYDKGGAKSDIQAVGSTVSYGKRYVACMLLNIITKNEDDDGRLAGMEPIDAASVTTIEGLIKEAGVTEDRFCKLMNISHVAELPTKDFRRAVNSLMVKKGEKK